VSTRGFCPYCGEPGVTQELGNDTCVRGHNYASRRAYVLPNTRNDHEALLAEIYELREWLELALDDRDRYRKEVEQERAAVVAALRRTSNHGPMGLSLVNLDSIADAIERGEHRREGEP
jgi:hypothetical protein